MFLPRLTSRAHNPQWHPRLGRCSGQILDCQRAADDGSWTAAEDRDRAARSRLPVLATAPDARARPRARPLSTACPRPGRPVCSAGWRTEVRARLVVLALITLFAILVGTTLLGIATNWPRDRTISRHRRRRGHARHHPSGAPRLPGLLPDPRRSDRSTGQSGAAPVGASRRRRTRHCIAALSMTEDDTNRGGPMNTADTTTEAFANTRPSSAEDLPDYAPVPRAALGPALNEQGYYVGRVERNLYWVTDGTYQSAFLTT